MESGQGNINIGYETYYAADGTQELRVGELCRWAERGATAAYVI